MIYADRSRCSAGAMFFILFCLVLFMQGPPAIAAEKSYCDAGYDSYRTVDHWDGANLFIRDYKYKQKRGDARSLGLTYQNESGWIPPSKKLVDHFQASFQETLQGDIPCHDTRLAAKTWYDTMNMCQGTSKCAKRANKLKKRVKLGVKGDHPAAAFGLIEVQKVISGVRVAIVLDVVAGYPLKFKLTPLRIRSVFTCKTKEVRTKINETIDNQMKEMKTKLDAIRACGK